jgi:hypothetical protein
MFVSPPSWAPLIAAVYIHCDSSNDSEGDTGPNPRLRRRRTLGYFHPSSRRILANAPAAVMAASQDPQAAMPAWGQGMSPY